MLIALLLAALPSGAISSDVAYDLLAGGHNTAAIRAMEADPAPADDPARLINLGIAYARDGHEEKARAMFEAAYRSRERFELETATGEWVDSRTLARQALAMLESGTFIAPGRLARN